MKSTKANLVGVTLLIASSVGVVHAADAIGLTPENFVDVGDNITEMIGTSGLAFSAMTMGAAIEHDARPRTAGFHPSPSAAGAYTYDSACPGGGRVIGRIRDADASGDLSTTDRFVTTFESCAIDGRVLTGSGEFIVAAHRFEGHTEITELEFRFKNLGSHEMRWTGPASVTLQSNLRSGTEHYTVRYRDLVVTHGANNTRWAFTLDLVRPPIGSQVVSVHGAMTIGDVHVHLRQDDPFVMPIDNFPRSGQLTATDDHGARMQVEAGRSRYAYRLFRAGNSGEWADVATRRQPYGTR